MYSDPSRRSRFIIGLIGDSVFYDNDKIVYPPFNLIRILTYLVINGQDRPVSRRQIGRMIWSDNPSEQIDADFRQTLVRIKRFQDDHDIRLLSADATTVWLNRGLNVYIDLMELIRLMANPEPKSWVRICEIYSGDLLGSHRPAGEEFEGWLERQRQTIRSGFINSLSLAILPTSDSTRIERQLCASRLLMEDPYHEGAYRALMQAAASYGEQSLTRRLYEQCRTVLLKELGVTPSAETITYYNSLMNG